MKSQDLVGNEITDEYKELLNERRYLETEKEKLGLEIERCKQDMVDAETIKKTLFAFDKIISALPIEDQKELLQLLIKEIRVFSVDPEKEKAPQESGAFITKSSDFTRLAKYPPAYFQNANFSINKIISKKTMQL